MKKSRTTIAALVSAFALSAAALSAAPAATAAKPEACSQQQAQLERAQAKYDALQQKFAEHPTKKNQKAKKAQAQRVSHAQTRLDRCTAGSTEG